MSLWVVVPAYDEEAPIGGTPAAREDTCGGAPRERLEGGSEDVTPLDRAPEHLVVQSSLRRLRSRGARRTPLWFGDRRYRPADTKEVHVR
ncbi:hypothetical protein [Streptomyces racemochromogenes]|uniref:hypothetical protein n=1 Tax=Streptomyces racemochromogenes TaxID=67353 RepID=UPI0031EBD54B